MVPPSTSLHHYHDTSWEFVTSSGIEIDAFVVGLGHGSFYIKDNTDPSGKVYQIKYFGLGLTKSKSPIPIAGASGSTKDMPSSGLEPIQSWKPRLTIDDFLGSGWVSSISLNIGTGEFEWGHTLTQIDFSDGVYGTMKSIQYMSPLTLGGTIMKVYFYL
jgi:hypothetical protein